VTRRSGAVGEAFVRRIFTEHGAALMAYASRLAGDRARGEAAVQEVLLRVWREPELIAGPAARAQLFTLVRGATAESMALLGALEGLPAEQRDVLRALYFQGCDVKEAAATLGLPPGDVKARSYQALTRLRAAVAG
jgi:RNA polymerase sigma-70 factor (ECF subfamily)